jgi:hypothetical protein
LKSKYFRVLYGLYNDHNWGTGVRDRKYAAIVWTFVGLAIVYAALVLWLPPDARALNKYNLSSHGAKVLSLSVVIPYVVIWFVALYGSLNFKRYADKIENNQDGKACSTLANGLLVLAFSMPISAVVNNINLYFSRKHASYLPAGTIINNYVNLVAVLMAFYIIYLGAKQLGFVLKKYSTEVPVAELLPLLFILASVAYSYLTLTNPARQHAAGSARQAAYYLPDWLLLVSIVVPYIFVLFFGLSAVWYMRLYSARVPGILYKRALRYVFSGIFVTVSSILTLRILASMTAWFETRTLKIILTVLYLLLIFIGVGYWLIAKGAKKLAKIEEVI